MAPIAPIAPFSRKHSTPSQSDDDLTDEPTSKKRCVESGQAQSPPLEEDIVPSVPKTPLFDEIPRQLLLRSVVLALEHVGFTGAQDEALEAICSEVDACMYLCLLPKFIFNFRQTPRTFCPRSHPPC
jgi:transcription initiation factor TFIID subunit 8